MRNIVPAVLLAFIASFAVAAEMPAPAPAAGPTPPDSGNLKYADVIKAAETFDEVVVWEGLPASTDKVAGDKAVAGKKAFRIGDNFFYTAPLALKEADRTTVSDAVLKHRENFKKWSGVKGDGRFHADYVIEWRLKGAAVAQTLLWSSGPEAEFRVGDRTERVDQSPIGAPIFTALLKPYHHN